MNLNHLYDHFKKSDEYQTRIIDKIADKSIEITNLSWVPLCSHCGFGDTFL